MSSGLLSFFKKEAARVLSDDFRRSLPVLLDVKLELANLSEGCANRGDVPAL